MLPNIGYGELLIILAIALLLFGAKRIPDLAKSLGQSINAFKAGLREGSPEDGAKAKNPPDETKTDETKT